MKLNKDKIREVFVRSVRPHLGKTAHPQAQGKFLSLMNAYKISVRSSSWAKGWISVPLWDRSSGWGIPGTIEYQPFYNLYAHMPKEIAEKIMVLGFVPDSDCLEKIPHRIH
jgi:hypothetical protein